MQLHNLCALGFATLATFCAVMAAVHASDAKAYHYSRTLRVHAAAAAVASILVAIGAAGAAAICATL